jgi:Ca2+-transporting ATPase
MLQDVIEEQTPLQQRLDRLGKWLAIAAIVLVVVIFVLGLSLGQPLHEMLLTAVSLAVAAIPEALTAVVTIALSLGAQRMLQRKALIRQLPAVETLGSVTVICSDKTGTLTQNRMSVTALDIANHTLELKQAEDEEGLRLVRVEGPEVGAGPGDELLPTLDLLLVSGTLCNDAVLERANHMEAHAGDVTLAGANWYAVGDPTEGAIILAAAEYGILKPELEEAFPRIDELPFDSTRKRMTTIHAMPTGEGEISPGLQEVWARRVDARGASHVAFTKGAVDSLLNVATSVWVNDEQMPLDDERRRRVLEANNRMAAQGKRVLGVAVRTLDHAPTKQEVKDIESDLMLVGLYGMIDPPRPEVRDAVLTCRSAGIRPVMITGDHPLTARHIAQQVGITDPAPGEEAPFLTGMDIDALTPEELRARAKDVQVFARVSPEHKLSLIEIYQEQGNIVAMTGDGVNDAPALKKADIGVAMGITGTDVSKEAANMVLLDDNFATIVAAVEEGRVVYDNIRKFIQYLLTCNASEIAVMLFWPVAAWIFGVSLGTATIALLPLQILWMNLVTDGLPALALGVEKAERNVMRRPPYSSEESIFGRGMLPFIGIFGVIMSIIAIAIGLWDFHRDPTGAWQTLLFTTLIFNQVMLALGLRSIEQSLFSIGLFSNPSMVAAFISTVLLQLMVIYVPFFQRIFRTQALDVTEVLLALSMGVLVLFIVEIWKWFLRRRMAA